MGKKLLVKIIMFFMLFGSFDYASGNGLYVEPTEFFSTYWVSFLEYVLEVNDGSWVELLPDDSDPATPFMGTGALRDAGGTWVNFYVGWGTIEQTPEIAANGEIIHTYRAGGSGIPDGKLSKAIDKLYYAGYRINFVLEPNMLGDWSDTWKNKVAAGDDDAQTALYKTLEHLAETYYNKIDAWQIDQEPSDIGWQVPYTDRYAYARILKAGYSGVKDGYESIGRNPDDVFVFFGFYILRSWIKDVFEYQAETYGRVYSDGVSAHLFRSNGPEDDFGKRGLKDDDGNLIFTGTMVDAITLAWIPT